MADLTVCPKSLARRRLRLSQAKVRSTTPPPRVDDEAGLVGEFAHDLDVDGGRHGDARAGIGAVGVGELHERVAAAR